MTRSPNNTFALKNDKNLASEAVIAALPAKLYPEQLLRFSTKLQSTLNLKALLDIFFHEMSQIVALDGLTFSSKEDVRFIEIGTLSKHHCEYQLNIKKESLGEITFHRSQRFKELELHHIETLLAQLIYPLKNSLSYQKAIASAYIDPLTGLANFKALQSTLDHEIAWVKHYSGPLTMIAIEISNSQSILNQYEKNAWHKTLSTITDTLNIFSKNTDLSFRYEDNRFAILLKQRSYHACQQFAIELQEAISRRTIHHNQHSFTVTPKVVAVQILDSHEDDSHTVLNEEKESLLKQINQMFSEMSDEVRSPKFRNLSFLGSEMLAE